MIFTVAQVSMNSTGLKWIRIALAFLVVAGVCYIIANLFATTANLLRLSAVGAEIAFADALRTYLFDLRGMAPTFSTWTAYGSVIFIGLAIAFPVAALLRYLAARSPARKLVPYLYPLAGATALATITYLMYQQYEVFAVAGARGTLGVAAQCLAGAIAGYLFQRSLPRAEQ